MKNLAVFNINRGRRLVGLIEVPETVTALEMAVELKSQMDMRNFAVIELN